MRKLINYTLSFLGYEFFNFLRVTNRTSNRLPVDWCWYILKKSWFSFFRFCNNSPTYYSNEKAPIRVSLESVSFDEGYSLYEWRVILVLLVLVCTRKTSVALRCQNTRSFFISAQRCASSSRMIKLHLSHQRYWRNLASNRSPLYSYNVHVCLKFEIRTESRTGLLDGNDGRNMRKLRFRSSQIWRDSRHWRWCLIMRVPIRVFECRCANSVRVDKFGNWKRDRVVNHHFSIPIANTFARSDGIRYANRVRA